MTKVDTKSGVTVTYHNGRWAVSFPRGFANWFSVALALMADVESAAQLPPTQSASATIPKNFVQKAVVGVKKALTKSPKPKA